MEVSLKILIPGKIRKTFTHVYVVEIHKYYLNGTVVNKESAL